MTPDGFEALELVKDYLLLELAPAQPDHVVTEIKAAAKLLDTAAAELACLHQILPGEISEIRDLCRTGLIWLADHLEDEARQVIDAARSTHAELLVVTGAIADLREMIIVQRRLNQLASTVIAHLHAHTTSKISSETARDAAGDLLAQFYETFGRHGQRRLPWQSVFPHVAAL